MFLDAGPLAELAHPRRSGDIDRWASDLPTGTRVLIPEIADYEVRRELVRAGSLRGLALLDRLQKRMEYVPITTAAMRRAATFWADARNAGRPTASPESLDADVILAAQAALHGESAGDEVIVATTNTGHLGRYVPAARWSEIGV